MSSAAQGKRHPAQTATGSASKQDKQPDAQSAGNQTATRSADKQDKKGKESAEQGQRPAAGSADKQGQRPAAGSLVEEEWINPKTGKLWPLCQMTSLPCREEHKYPVIDDPDCTSDWAKYPFEYIRTRRNPWNKSAFVFRTVEMMLRWGADHGPALQAPSNHLMRQMIAIHHGITRQIQPSPPSQVMKRFQATGRGLSDAQMMQTRLFPSAIFAFLRCPRKPQIFPNEEHVFSDRNASVLRYYSTTGIPDEIVRRLWVDKLGVPIKTIPWDGDPDSDAEVDFMPLVYAQDEENKSKTNKSGAKSSRKGSKKMNESKQVSFEEPAARPNQRDKQDDEDRKPGNDSNKSSSSQRGRGAGKGASRMRISVRKKAGGK